MYYHDIYRFPGSVEHEYKYAGKYGAAGEKRGKRKKPTAEQIARQNQLNRIKRMRRLIKANFQPTDLWCTLKYPAGTRKEVEEVKHDLQTFLRRMRKEYKKTGEPFKYVYRMEVGAHGGLHFHMLINRVPGMQTDILIQRCWTYGSVNYESIYEQGGYRDLAAYIVKQPEKGSDEYKQLSLFDSSDQKELLSVSSSRNLERPKPERKEYKRLTLRKLIEHGPTPAAGYYIDKDSITFGTNPYTGMNYYQYTEVLLNGDERRGHSPGIPAGQT